MGSPRFVFALEPLLDVRRQTEKEHQRKVAAIQEQINGLVAKIRDAERSIRDRNRGLATQRLVGRLDLAFITQEKRYVGTLQLVIMQTLQNMAVLERQMAAAKAALLEAAKARKVIEKLRERRLERWRAEQNRLEAAEMDEIGTQIAMREIMSNAP